MRPLRIGHRGAMGYAPENTMASFQKAILMNCDGVELDVHSTKDGKVIVFHDETLERLTGANGKVREFDYSYLSSLNIGGERIPLLSDVIEMLPQDMLINIEIKASDATEPVADLILHYLKTNGYKRFLVSSFDWNSLSLIRELDSKIPIGVLAHTDLSLAISFSEFINAQSIHPHFHMLTAEKIRHIQSKDIRVFTWTVNQATDISLVKSFGVNAIITDYPDRV